MGSSRNLFLLLGILFVLLFLLSSHVAPSNAQTTGHIDKKNGNVVPLPNSVLLPQPILPGRPFCNRKVYASCIPRGGIPPKRRCVYPNNCSPGRAQFKDDFHN